MTFKDAEIELQGGIGGASLVVKNPIDGYCVVLDDVDSDDVDTITDIFGDEVQG